MAFAWRNLRRTRNVLIHNGQPSGPKDLVIFFVGNNTKLYSLLSFKTGITEFLGRVTIKISGDIKLGLRIQINDCCEGLIIFPEIVQCYFFFFFASSLTIIMLAFRITSQVRVTFSISHCCFA